MLVVPRAASVSSTFPNCCIEKTVAATLGCLVSMLPSNSKQNLRLQDKTSPNPQLVSRFQRGFCPSARLCLPGFTCEEMAAQIYRVLSALPFLLLFLAVATMTDD